VCPAVPVLESAWVSLGVLVAVWAYLCLHVTFAPPSHLDNSPLHSLPLLGPEPALRSRLPSHWLSFCCTPPNPHPRNGWLSQLLLTSSQAFLSHWPREGHRQRRGTKDTLQSRGRGGAGGGLYRASITQVVPSSLLQPCQPATLLIILGPSSTPPPLHTHTHTL
jgi:hypothetical protein